MSGLTATLLAGVAAATLVATPAEAATVQIIEKQSPRNSSTYKEVWVPCPDQTMRGISGDFQLSGPKSIKINAVVPSSGGVWFLASESTATSEDWSYFARAYCSPVAGLPGLEYKVRSAYFSGARSDTPDSLSTNLNCPVGKGIIGMGAWVRYQDGTPNKPPQNKIVLTTLYARHTGQFDNTGNAGASAQHSGFNGDWELELTAVCVNQVSGLTTDGGWGLESGDTAYDEVRCPGATKVHAGLLLGLRPDEDPGAHLLRLEQVLPAVVNPLGIPGQPGGAAEHVPVGCQRHLCLLSGSDVAVGDNVAETPAATHIKHAPGYWPT